MLIIGTGNKYRFKSIKSLIEEIDKNIICVQKSISIDESGNSSVENAKIKAVAYSHAFKGRNVLCVDDEMHLDDSSYTPGEVLNRDKRGKNISKKEILEYWNKVLEGRELKGHINKVFVFINNEGDAYSEILRIDISLSRDKTRYMSMITNPLNNFIVPEGFCKVIADFNSDELSKFRMPQLKLLEKLLLNYGPK
jgi:hypothetical protein